MQSTFGGNFHCSTKTRNGKGKGDLLFVGKWHKRHRANKCSEAPNQSGALLKGLRRTCVRGAQGTGSIGETEMVAVLIDAL